MTDPEHDDNPVPAGHGHYPADLASPVAEHRDLVPALCLRRRPRPRMGTPHPGR